jgi:hypothetical protein
VVAATLADLDAAAITETESVAQITAITDTDLAAVTEAESLAASLSDSDAAAAVDAGESIVISGTFALSDSDSASLADSEVSILDGTGHPVYPAPPITPFGGGRYESVTDELSRLLARALADDEEILVLT